MTIQSMTIQDYVRLETLEREIRALRTRHAGLCPAADALLDEAISAAYAAQVARFDGMTAEGYARHVAELRAERECVRQEADPAPRGWIGGGPDGQVYPAPAGDAT